jgi:hypothetical protein
MQLKVKSILHQKVKNFSALVDRPNDENAIKYAGRKNYLQR